MHKLNLMELLVIVSKCKRMAFEYKWVLVLVSVTDSKQVLWSVSECYWVLVSHIECYWVLVSVSER